MKPAPRARPDQFRSARAARRFDFGSFAARVLPPPGDLAAALRTGAFFVLAVLAVSLEADCEDADPLPALCPLPGMDMPGIDMPGIDE